MVSKLYFDPDDESQFEKDTEFAIRLSLLDVQGDEKPRVHACQVDECLLDSPTVESPPVQKVGQYS